MARSSAAAPAPRPAATGPVVPQRNPATSPALLAAGVASVWAKSPDGDGNWLPLYQHLRDTAAVARWLWDNWLPDRTRAVLAESLGLTDTQARTVAVYLAGVHDIGKATPVFAAMCPEMLAQNVAAGLEGEFRPKGSREDHHTRTGHAAMAVELAERGAKPLTADTWAVVVGAHHGDPPKGSEVWPLMRPGRRSPMGGLGWREVRDTLLAEHWASSGLGRVVDQRGWFPLPQTAQTVLTGLVIVADWIASNEEMFGYTDLDDPHRLTRAVAKLGLPAPWRVGEVPTEVADLYDQRFGDGTGSFVPRPVQDAVADVVSMMPDAGLVIVEAPMGEGKTEAALVAAEVLAARTGAGGIHIALPTQATSDGMFSRVVDWTDRLPATDLPIGASVWLGHRKAGMNQVWTDLGAGTREVDSDGGHRTAPHPWMRGRKKAHLATVAVSTVDQLLLSALRARHLMMRHLSLVGKVVIVDEVHAYDAWMNGYLDRVLTWLGAYRVPVVLLSATLPPSRRAALVAAYTGEPAPEEVAAQQGYPLVTVAGPWGCEQTEPPASGRRTRVQLEFVGDDPKTVVDRVAAAVEAGGCVLVIRNTVGRAQELAGLLEGRLGADRVMLNHSRFLAVDRAELDVSLLNRFGSPKRLAEVGGKRPAGHVVVATQVAEQSLDVDFDLLATDLAPVDLVLQRIGRLHRHVRPRPGPLVDPVCLVTGVELHGDDEPPTLDRGGRAVYREWALLRAAHVLAGRTHVDLPGDIAELVRSAYEGTSVRPGWQDAQDRAVHEEERVRDDKEWGSATFQVAAPDGDEPFFSWVDGSTSDDDTAGQAQVRDGEPTLEVTVLVRDGQGALRLPSWPVGLSRPGDEIPTDRAVDPWRYRDLEGCALRLPARLSTQAVEAELWDATPPAWRRGMSRSDRPLLALDEHLTTGVGDHLLAYHPRQGLTVTREETR